MRFVRRLIACYAIGSVFLALQYAPFFHVHADDGHHGGPLLHAHFPEIQHHLTSAGTAIEDDDHNHNATRSVDVLASRTAGKSVHELALLRARHPIATPAVRYNFVSVEAPRAHSPPDSRSFTPRSPPSL